MYILMPPFPPARHLAARSSAVVPGSRASANPDIQVHADRSSSDPAADTAYPQLSRQHLHSATARVVACACGAGKTILLG